MVYYLFESGILSYFTQLYFPQVNNNNNNQQAQQGQVPGQPPLPQLRGVNRIVSNIINLRLPTVPRTGGVLYDIMSFFGAFVFSIFPR